MPGGVVLLSDVLYRILIIISIGRRGDCADIFSEFVAGSINLKMQWQTLRLEFFKLGGGQK
jgi:hypothetical protein